LNCGKCLRYISLGGVRIKGLYVSADDNAKRGALCCGVGIIN
jgi:hypothetical protein